MINKYFLHYKGKYYQVEDEALDTRDDSIVVVYRTLYPSEYRLYTRPKEEFYGMVSLPDGTRQRRFVSVAFEDLPARVKAYVTE